MTPFRCVNRLAVLAGVHVSHADDVWHVVDPLTGLTQLSRAGDPLRFYSVDGLLYCLDVLAGLKPGTTRLCEVTS